MSRNQTEWEQLDDPPPSKAPLSLRSICQAAMKIADREGIDAVTMRRIASDLGVAAMAIYRHATSKAEVIELMVSSLGHEMCLKKPPTGSNNWKEDLRTWALHARSACLRHPWVAEISAEATGGVTPGAIEMLDQLVEALAPSGLEEAARVEISAILITYVRSMAQSEILQSRELALAGEVTSERRKQFLAGVRYRAIETHAFSPLGGDRLGARFELGLDALLEGIASRHGV